MGGNVSRTTLGDYVTLVRGTTYKGTLVGKPGPALLGLGSIELGGGFRYGHFKTYGGDCPNELMLYPGDMYASLKGATKDGKMIGSVARVPSTVASGRLTQDTVKLVFRNPNAEDASYLHWVLRTPQYRDYCNGHAMGSAVVALSRRDFLAYPVPIPTTEHRLAVAILDAIEERIEINRRINETLEAMARALFKSWFVDFDPVRAKGEGCATGLPKEISELFPESFEDSELGEVPKGWTVGKIGDLLALSRSGLNPGAFEDEVFEHYSIPAFDDGRTPKIEEGQSIKSNKFIVVPGCVLLSKLNPRTPRIWLPLLSSPLRARAVCSTEFLVTLPKHNSSQEFLYCLLSSDNFTTEFTTLVTGTSGSHQRVRPESLLNLDSVLPPLGLVQRFTELVSPMLHRINQNLAESGTLTAQRDTLLPKLLSGEIRIGQPKPPGAIQSLGEKG